MKRFLRAGQIAFLDSLGVCFMVAALLTGWLPGPGGVPLFIIGLSLLGINHTWAKRYIDLIRRYTDRISDVIFSKDRSQRNNIDGIGPLLTAIGALLVYRHAAVWQTSVGISVLCTGLVLLLGNRSRWPLAKKWLKKQFKR
jgi:hypothetical protein